MENDDNSTEETRLILEEWKTVIQTQMHFNDMIMKMRTTGVTIVLAFFGAAAISLQYEMYLTICGFSFHTSVLIITCGLIMLAGIFVMDYLYYYKMLLGAVERGYQIDRVYKDKTVDGVKMFGLSTEISKAIGRPHLSKILVFTFYGLFFALGILFIAGILVGYPPTLNSNA